MAPRASRTLVTVAVVDNHDVVRDGLLAVLGGAEEFRPVGGFAEIAPVLQLAQAPQVVILDLYLGRDDRTSVPGIPGLIAHGCLVVLHTAEERPVPLRDAVAAGVSGLSLKNDGTAALLDVIMQVVSGEFVCSSALAGALIHDGGRAARLTDREVEVLRSLDDGLTQQQAGRRLGISEETVKTHLRSVRAKYGELRREVTNTASLVREAGRDGWLR